MKRDSVILAGVDDSEGNASHPTSTVRGEVPPGIMLEEYN